MASMADLINASRGSILASGTADDLLAYVNSITSILGSADLVGTARTGPTVTDFRRLGVNWQPTRLILTLDEALDPATASILANYRITAAGPDGRFGTRDDVTIPIKSVTYDPVARTVSLTTAAGRLSWTKRTRFGSTVRPQRV